MMDALLNAVVDTVREAGFGWDKINCAVTPDGRPPPRCVDWFLAVHQDGEHGDMQNALDEYYSFMLTLNMVTTKFPRDRLGETAVVSRAALTLAKESGFNARAQQLKTFLHMNWFVIFAANNWLLKLYEQANVVNGFAEPAQWDYTDKPALRGGEWLASDPNAQDCVLTAEIRFKDARRLQPMAEYV